MTDYNAITKAYRLARRTFPHPQLSREEAAQLLRFPTGSLPSPGLMHRKYAETYATDKCKVCRREKADSHTPCGTASNTHRKQDQKRSHRGSRHPRRATTRTSRSGPSGRSSGRSKGRDSVSRQRRAETCAE
ncbi:hypothetical protein HPB52_002506 [Rhipicephalus sanguineus]|uniref:Uncharacterized protein n=1 Tax=Rhipicephalus sanguineus TaxID=34632 RepID=A0A9D4Q9B1_RHISA|nr:hypothetical protein HPB52_002506 [Rhipicephalus sanguineus]